VEVDFKFYRRFPFYTLTSKFEEPYCKTLKLAPTITKAKGISQNHECVSETESDDEAFVPVV